jgi:hypothetical protein
METSASFEARSAPLPYPTANERTYGSVRGVLGNQHPYRDRLLPKAGVRVPRQTCALQSGQREDGHCV